ncbi:MAG: YlmH/Sll1252 family protein [Clostridia bacterium]
MKNRQEILDKYKVKEERIFVSNILDKINKFEITNNIIYTNFLNLNEFNIATNLINQFNINYTYFSLNDILEKRSIAIIPEYIKQCNFENISCIKVKNNSQIKLLHKDYMGAIYNIGIAEDMIGDIIVKENIAYIFLMKSILEYVLLNFNKVGNIKVEIETIDINNIDISYNFEDINIIVSSKRIDIVLSHLYNLSRNEIDKKILKNELVINSKIINNKTYLIKENDIIAFKKCGKFKYIGISKTTKTGNLVINIKKYS